MTRMRNDDKVVEFTEEFLSNLPVATNFSDVWYDKEQPYMFARKRPYGIPETRLGIVAGREIIRGAMLQGVRVPRLGLMPKMPLSEARAKALEIRKQHLEYAKVGKVRRSSANNRLPIPGEGGPLDISQLLSGKELVDNPNYDSLMSVLMDAFQQAATGKGAERHAAGLNFEDQDIIQIMDGVGINFSLGQAMKKILEGRRLKMNLARDEFLGAIVYLAGAIVWMDKQVRKDK